MTARSESARPFEALERYWNDPAYRAEVDRMAEERQRDVYDRMDCAIERYHRVPHEERIARVMKDLGFDRMQAINHLRQRDELAARLRGRW